jgi:tetratricopeptide (TPR) repeat protein
MRTKCMPKRIAVLALCAIAFSVSIFAATPEQMFTEAKLALLADNPDRAATLFEQLVKMQPNNSSYHLWLGQSYGMQTMKASMFSKPGLASKTREQFELAVKTDPNSIEARLGLLDYYSMAPGFMGGSDEKALQQAQEIKKRDAIEGHRAMARIYARDKKTDLAKKEVLDAVREQPNSPKAHMLVSGLYYTEKNWKQALDEAEAALKVDPNYMPAYYRIGVIAVNSASNFVRGEEALRKYVTYKPGDFEPAIPRAWYWLGQLYEKQGRKEDAKQSYQTALRLAPGAKDVTDALKRVS